MFSAAPAVFFLAFFPFLFCFPASSRYFLLFDFFRRLVAHSVALRARTRTADVLVAHLKLTSDTIQMTLIGKQIVYPRRW